jgi:hypothetical protein
MKIDRNNPPTEVWHVSRDRIRKGEGVQYLTPLSNSWWHSALRHSSFQIKGRPTRYWNTESYATCEEAVAEARRLLRIDLTLERDRHASLMKRLNKADQALKEQEQ